MYKLFLNPNQGPDFMLRSKISKAGLEVDYLLLQDNKEEYKKYGIRSTPKLLIFDNEGNYDTIVGMEEILKELKNLTKEDDSVQDT